MTSAPPLASDAPSGRQPKPGQLYADAVWDADPDVLSQAELVMALCYANHAHRPPYDRAWVTNERLMQQCKIRSTSTVGRVRESLVEKGWLIPLHPATAVPLEQAEWREFQRKRKTIPYRLVIPPASSTSEEATSTVEQATTSMVEEEESPATSTIETTTSTIETHYFDGGHPPSSDPPKDPPPSLSAAEQAIDAATDATSEERREMIILITQENRVRNADKYVPAMKPLDLAGYLARVRAGRVRTPGPPPAADVLAAQAAHVPQPRGDDPPPPATETLAALRARIGHAAPKTRFAAAPERVEPPEVTAARAELVRGGDFPVWMEAAYAKLGKDADRDEAVLLAAELARASRTPISGATP